MNNKQDTAITLNGIRFTPTMMETLKEWYSQPMPEDYIPSVMLECLDNVQHYLIEISEDHSEKDEKTMRALRQLLYVMDYVKPFTEGGTA